MAALLSVSVGYLLGETRDADPIWVDSEGSWHSWMRENSGVEASLAVEVWDQWKHEYYPPAFGPSIVSFRELQKPMIVVDWDKRYQALLKTKAKVENNDPAVDPKAETTS
jgi:hypothetical protein